MTIAILTFLGALVPLLAAWIYRRWKRKDSLTPADKYAASMAQIEKAYAKKDEKAIALHLDDALDHIERMQQSPRVDGKQQGDKD